MRRSLELLDPPWWSDHASFAAVVHDGRRRSTGFFLPPLQSRESVALIADNIKQLQDIFGRPFAFETGVNYFPPRAGELPDGAFWGAIAEAAQCGILLDLHNVWANGHNGRAGIDEVLGEIACERVWEVHLAGGEERDGFWLDSHCGLPPPGLEKALAKATDRLPNLKAVIFEIFADYLNARDIATADMVELIGRMRAVLRERRPEKAAEAPVSSAGKMEPAILPRPGAWEDYVEAGIKSACSRCAPNAVADKDEPACRIYADLVTAARRGAIVDILPLTARYLLLLLGLDGFENLLRLYVGDSDPQAFMASEADNFARYLAERTDHSDAIQLSTFELAAQRAATSGRIQTCALDCDPEELIEAIGSGRLPATLQRRPTEVELLPPATAATG